MKCSLGISNFFEEISSLSHYVVFLYFFALIGEEGFLISSCYLELCIQMSISFISPLLFASRLFTAICKASSDSLFAFLHFFFLGMVLIPVQCHKLPTIAERSNPKSKERWMRRCRRAERRYSTFKVRRGSCEDIPLIQSKEERLRFAGAALKRYPISKVTETQVRS